MPHFFLLVVNFFSYFRLKEGALLFQFQFVYSQPIRIEAEKGRTLN